MKFVCIACPSHVQMAIFYLCGSVDLSCINKFNMSEIENEYSNISIFLQLNNF